MQHVGGSILSLSVQAIKPAAAGSADEPLFAQSVESRTGTGFFVTSTGVLVTNRHVIENAYAITVTMPDGSRRPAHLVGAASGFDVALVRVDVDQPSEPVKLGNSDAVAVGDQVIAVGSSLGFENTVTSGIVSALHRAIDVNDYEELIQTDAPINLGNSGGPLFDLSGAVVGINTVITATSTAGGSVGIAFAIPINDVRFIIDGAAHPETIAIGWAGVTVQTVTPDIADALHLAPGGGVIVSTLIDGGPAAMAGLRQGDVIQSFDGRPIASLQTFNRLVAGAAGRSVPLKIWRSGQTVEVKLAVRESPRPLWATPANAPAPTPLRQTIQQLGIVLEPMAPALAGVYGLPAETKGTLVAAVSTDGFAARAGLKQGDLIRSIQLAPVASPADVQAKLDAARTSGDRHLLLLVQRDKGELWMTLPVDAPTK